jgi:hypothetical protein
MSYLGRWFYGEPAASSTPPPPTSGPELKPGWEVYKNQRGEILYGNNLMPACQFNAPVAQAQTAPVAQAPVAQAPVAQAQSASRPWGAEPEYPSWFSPAQRRTAHDNWLSQNMMNNPYFNGGLKRKQSRRKRMQSKRKRMQSRRRS